ncbi:hypothetical protein A3C26_01880 [Candidatus Daviesbacteria bacterium RIFCSPHIGHO2_02_FULL_39_12]|uniref:Uncharacterized protein n=2 Tax=Candidatus Daviesiibacteriota TaxID=1752718 RepID=A0A1F5JD78_9BACT|nr:MAG: hypothetical protein A3C26_01880 [Candidatus Daviesbacteria bacterium RIFCSPHIGHO2_02_FULL_39_12]OGE71529.1 MAG: hypothetical protein A3H40_00695 [Candidatus Daviesbacteria bacterium RIFCSPLOWO2_02_FULL_38_15]
MNGVLTLPEFQKRLKEFKLSGMVKTLELRLKQTEEDGLGCSEFLALLPEDEINQRTDNRRKRLKNT